MWQKPPRTRKVKKPRNGGTVELTAKRKKDGDQTDGDQTKEGRHVGLDFYDLLIEALMFFQERTPMQWDGSENAGFSKATPWLPVPPAYKTHNVAAESQQPDSVLEFYKKVLKLRHTNRALLDGSYTPLNESDQNVFSYLRSYTGDAVLWR
jgi:glycosidase